MTGPFRDDNEAAIQRADALEDELERERAKTKRLEDVEEALTAENERLRVENARVSPHAAPVEVVDRPARSWRHRALRYVVDTLTDPSSDVTFGQLLIW